MPKASKKTASQQETLEGYEGRFERFEGGWTVGPGHTPFLYAGTEVVEFSPTEELERTLAVVTRNVEAMETAS